MESHLDRPGQHVFHLFAVAFEMEGRRARVERGAVFSILVEHEAGGACGGWVEVVIEKVSLLAHRPDDARGERL
jgi:hypothetical protein